MTWRGQIEVRHILEGCNANTGPPVSWRQSHNYLAVRVSCVYAGEKHLTTTTDKLVVVVGYLAVLDILDQLFGRVGSCPYV